jgi:hypothetical protein
VTIKLELLLLLALIVASLILAPMLEGSGLASLVP